VAIYFRPPALLRDFGLLRDELFRDDAAEDLLEPFFEPRLRLRLLLELELELEREREPDFALDERDRFFGSPPFELFGFRDRVCCRRGFRRGASSSGSSSSSSCSSSSYSSSDDASGSSSS
jgi:hypothetical protein